MSNYVVEYSSDSITHEFKVEAYSPTEAAFLAGAGLGAAAAVSGETFFIAKAIGATSEEVQDAMQQAVREGFGGVLVREARYADQ